MPPTPTNRHKIDSDRKSALRETPCDSTASITTTRRGVEPMRRIALKDACNTQITYLDVARDSRCETSPRALTSFYVLEYDFIEMMRELSRFCGASTNEITGISPWPALTIAAAITTQSEQRRWTTHGHQPRPPRKRLLQRGT